MGGAIGSSLAFGGHVVSTAAAALGSTAAENRYYRSMAATAREQAAQIQEAAKRNTSYLFEQAAYQNSQLGQQYAQLLGTQKTTLAANGLGSQSETVQRILKNSRLNAQMDQELLQQNMQRAIFETNLKAGLEEEQYRIQANQYDQIRHNKSGLLSRISTALNGILNWK